MEKLSLNTQNGHSIEVVFSNAADGNMDTRFGDEPEVYANRDKLYNHLGLSALNITWMRAHGGRVVHHMPDVAEVDDTHGRGIVCDGLVTGEFDQGLALFPADCIPMIIYDERQPVAALIHVGSPGAKAGIHLEAIDQMVERYGSTPADLSFYLGPHIRSDSYKFPIGNGFKPDEQMLGFIHSNNGHHHIDLTGFAKAGLLDAGIDQQQISDIGHDTGDPGQHYYSHRRSQLTDEREGRNGVVVTIRPNK